MPDKSIPRTAHEDCGGLAVKRDADTLAGKLFGRGYAAAVYDNRAMAKDPGREYRERHEGQLPRREAADIFRARHLADVEFQPAGHAIKNLARIIENQKIEIDPVRFDVADMERQHPVVETAGEGDRQGRHLSCSAGFANFFSYYYTAPSAMSLDGPYRSNSFWIER
jgi:hypothetical protein